MPNQRNDKMAGQVSQFLQDEGYSFPDIIRIATVVMAIEGMCLERPLERLVKDLETAYNMIDKKVLAENRKITEGMMNQSHSKRVH